MGQKRKKLEEEKLTLRPQFENYKLVSDQRNSDLQNQITELKALLIQQSENGDQLRKKVKINPVLPVDNTSPATLSNQSTALIQSIINSSSFSSVQTEMDVDASEKKEKKVIRPPPIYVYGVTDYRSFSAFLVDNKVDSCTRKETSTALILNTTTPDEYRQLHSVLRKECSDKKGSTTFGEIQ